MRQLVRCQWFATLVLGPVVVLGCQHPCQQVVHCPGPVPGSTTKVWHPCPQVVILSCTAVDPSTGKPTSSNPSKTVSGPVPPKPADAPASWLPAAIHEPAPLSTIPGADDKKEPERPKSSVDLPAPPAPVPAAPVSSTAPVKESAVAPVSTQTKSEAACCGSDGERGQTVTGKLLYDHVRARRMSFDEFAITAANTKPPAPATCVTPVVESRDDADHVKTSSDSTSPVTGRLLFDRVRAYQQKCDIDFPTASTEATSTPAPMATPPDRAAAVPAPMPAIASAPTPMPTPVSVPAQPAATKEQAPAPMPASVSVTTMPAAPAVATRSETASPKSSPGVTAPAATSAACKAGPALPVVPATSVKEEVVPKQPVVKEAPATSEAATEHREVPQKSGADFLPPADTVTSPAPTADETTAPKTPAKPRKSSASHDSGHGSHGHAATHAKDEPAPSRPADGPALVPTGAGNESGPVMPTAPAMTGAEIMKPQSPSAPAAAKSGTTEPGPDLADVSQPAAKEEPAGLRLTDAPMSQPGYDHAADYSWLAGELVYDHVRDVWHLRYALADGTDRYGGSVMLFGAGPMTAFKTGQYARVEGEILDPYTRVPGPVYKVRSIQPPPAVK